MFKTLQTAVKFFVYGLVAGLLFAPRSGNETRQQLLSWLNTTVKETAGTLTGQGGQGNQGGQGGQ
ncbi:MAG: YtxH domain-containing protein [Chloroflexota bacterium]|nr:YtxH domain-containing protein [Chloroflexota bacterium]